MGLMLAAPRPSFVLGVGRLFDLISLAAVAASRSRIHGSLISHSNLIDEWSSLGSSLSSSEFTRASINHRDVCCIQGYKKKRFGRPTRTRAPHHLQHSESSSLHTVILTDHQITILYHTGLIQHFAVKIDALSFVIKIAINDCGSEIDGAWIFFCLLWQPLCRRVGRGKGGNDWKWSDQMQPFFGF